MLENSIFYKCKSKKVLLDKLGLNCFNVRNINDQIRPLIKEVFLNKNNGFEQENYISGETRILLMDSKKDSSKFSIFKQASKIIHRDLSNCLKKKKIIFLQSTIKGTNSYKNASIHSRARYIMAADIKNFFGNTFFITIKKFCEEKLQMSHDASALFAEIVCYHHSDSTFSLGQGYSSSPILSFACNFDLFNEINSLLQKEKQHFNFSVYVDDVTISSNEYISKEIIKSIKNIFNKYKYKLNKSKLKIQKINLKPLVVTGVSIQLDKVLPYKVKKGINYIRELNGLIKLISKYSDKKMNNKIRSTLILKTKKGGDLFRKYHGVYTYVKSAQNEIIKKTEKNRYFRAWLKSRKKFSKVNNLILKTSKMWGKKPEKLSKNEKYKLKSTIKKINEIKTWKIIRNKKTA